MKRLALVAAAAVTMTGTMTSQAAVRAYVVNGNCAGGNQAGSIGCGTGDGPAWFPGNADSVNQILQMIVSGNSGAGCLNSWNQGAALTFQGTGDSVLLPNCLGNGDGFETPDCPAGWDEVLRPNLPGPNYPGTSNGSKPQAPDTQNLGTTIPEIQNPGTPAPEIPTTPAPETQVTDQERSSIEQVIRLVNEERAKAGLAPVTEASDVSAAAGVRAREIPRSFAHVRPDGSNYSTALDQSGVRYMGSGENIAYGQRSPQEVMNGWMNSPGHRANILNGSYTKIGVGYYQNANGVKYWVQLFTY